MEIKEMIAVMQAFAEGKTIEYYSSVTNKWEKITSIPDWNWGLCRYRVKDEKKLRPYTFEELQAEMAKGKIVVKQVNLKGINRILTITQMMDDYDKDSKIQLSDFKYVSYEQLLENYQWLDGSPCGVIEE